MIKGRNNPLFLTDYGFRMSVTTIKKLLKEHTEKLILMKIYIHFIL